MAAIPQFITNWLNAQKSTSTRSLSMSLGAPADCFMQNKPNSRKAEMKLNFYSATGYESKLCFRVLVKQTQSNPISKAKKMLLNIFEL